MLQRIKITLLLLFLSANIYSQEIKQLDNTIFFKSKTCIDTFVIDTKENLNFYTNTDYVKDSIFVLFNSCGSECSYSYFFFAGQSRWLKFFNVYAIDFKNGKIATSENDRTLKIYNFYGELEQNISLDIKVPYLFYYTDDVYFSNNFICLKWNSNIDDKIEGSSKYTKNKITYFKIKFRTPDLFTDYQHFTTICS